MTIEEKFDKDEFDREADVIRTSGFGDEVVGLIRRICQCKYDYALLNCKKRKFSAPYLSSALLCMNDNLDSLKLDLDGLSKKLGVKFKEMYKIFITPCEKFLEKEATKYNKNLRRAYHH